MEPDGIGSLYQAFEQAMKKLDGIVSKLEEGDVPLE